MLLVFKKTFIIVFFCIFLIGEDMTLINKFKIDNFNKATFGAGCFWCVEAVFEQLDGVMDVAAGYSGGGTDNPNYDDVSKGDTGHAEVIRISYDYKIITFDELLKYF